MKNFDYRRFQIGDWVLIKNVASTQYCKGLGDNDNPNCRPDLKCHECEHKDDKYLVRKPPEIVHSIGQVVGLTKLQEGRRREGGVNHYMSISGVVDEDYEPPYLEVRNTYLVWLVRTGLMNKPFKVLDIDIQKIHGMTNAKLPILCLAQPPFREEDKQFLREVMKDHPRDEKGRWKKL